jgi:hypothetical protein
VATMKSERRRRVRPEQSSTLPVWKAFVVQFSSDTAKATTVFSGRIEHLSSGRRSRFASRDELVTTLLRMIDELGEKRPEPEPT